MSNTPPEAILRQIHSSSTLTAYLPNNHLSFSSFGLQSGYLPAGFPAYIMWKFSVSQIQNTSSTYRNLLHLSLVFTMFNLFFSKRSPKFLNYPLYSYVNLLKVFAMCLTTYTVFFSCVQSTTLFTVCFEPKYFTGTAIRNFFYIVPIS
jgi:hypothetical protein